MIEATYHGVPLVVIPMLGDQYKNAKFIQNQGFGEILKFENISTESVNWTINEVLSNNR